MDDRIRRGTIEQLKDEIRDWRARMQSHVESAATALFTVGEVEEIDAAKVLSLARDIVDCKGQIARRMAKLKELGGAI